MADIKSLPQWEAPPELPPQQPTIARKPIPTPMSKQTVPDVTSATYSRPTLTERFNRVVPPYRTYFGRSRRTFLLVICALLLLLILVLGLGLGLGLKHSHHNLPLPSNTDIFTGDLTYYAPALGACGITSSSSDSICSVSHIIFDAASTGSDPNANPLCKEKIRVSRYDASKGGNRTVDVQVVDRCVRCKATDLDLSPSGFKDLADEAEGKVVGSWAWLR